jgi:ABC-2 type transport system ATP-binding protein
MREYSKIGEQKVEVASRMSTSNQTLSLNDGSGAMERRRMVVSPSSQNPAIEARNLVKTYPRGVRAVDDLSFSVETGTIFGLLGPNGAGKSTTVKILTTLSRPDSGEARIAGIDVLREPDHVRRVIGCVAQRSGVDREATARENLMLQGHIYGLNGKELKLRVSELLGRFGLTEAANRVAGGYSGGMQRRLDIAMGLIHRPSVLFLDEPTTGLDPEVRADTWREIARLSTKDGLTILLTTHYLEEADHLAQNLAIVDHGRIVAAGTPERLKGELHGDTIQIELAISSENGRVQAVIERLPGVHELVVEGRTLRARVDSSATAIPAVLATLDGADIPVASILVTRPSLDDVYLRYTGRSFTHADTEGVR